MYTSRLNFRSQAKAFALLRQHAGTLDHLHRHFPGYSSRVLVPGAGLAGLGFSLKPPQWLRTAAAQIIGGTKVSVPSVNIPLPGGGSVQTPGTKPTFPQQAQQMVEQIPGGWLTLAAVGLGAVLLLKRR
jgi:hypothetical protein